MSKSIVIDKESYTRTKKKLKKSLEAKGVSFTLSEVSDILAQSFGFKNEFDMHKKYFESLNEIPKSEVVSLTSEQESLLRFMGEPSDGCEIIAGKNRDGMSNKTDNQHSPWIDASPVIFNDQNGNHFEYNPADINKSDTETYNKSSISVDQMMSMLKKLDVKNTKGNIVIAGKVGVGVTTLLNKVLDSNPKFETIDHHEHKLSLNGDARTGNDLEDVSKRNNKGISVVFGIHANSKEVVLNRIKSLNPNFDINSIRYLFLLRKSSDNLLEVYVYDMFDEHDRLQVFGMEWKRK